MGLFPLGCGVCRSQGSLAEQSLLQPLLLPTLGLGGPGASTSPGRSLDGPHRHFPQRPSGLLWGCTQSLQTSISLPDPRRQLPSPSFLPGLFSPLQRLSLFFPPPGSSSSSPSMSWALVEAQRFSASNLYCRLWVHGLPLSQGGSSGPGFLLGGAGGDR